MFRLALALGCTVSELTARLSSKELVEWWAYSNLEPWGDRRADLRSAIQAYASAAPWSKTAKVTDFLLDFEPAAERQMTVEEWRSYLISLGGKTRG